MSRHHEPNASHYSARYAERKRAAERARDAARSPSPCNRCPTPQMAGSIFCADHAAEHTELVRAAQTSGWAPEAVQAASDFCRRTYWPSKGTR